MQASYSAIHIKVKKAWNKNRTSSKQRVRKFGRNVTNTSQAQFLFVNINITMLGLYVPKVATHKSYTASHVYAAPVLNLLASAVVLYLCFGCRNIPVTQHLLEQLWPRTQCL